MRRLGAPMVSPSVRTASRPCALLKTSSCLTSIASLHFVCRPLRATSEHSCPRSIARMCQLDHHQLAQAVRCAVRQFGLVAPLPHLVAEPVGSERLAERSHQIGLGAGDRGEPATSASLAGLDHVCDPLRQGVPGSLRRFPARSWDCSMSILSQREARFPACDCPATDVLMMRSTFSRARLARQVERSRRRSPCPRRCRGSRMRLPGSPRLRL